MVVIRFVIYHFSCTNGTKALPAECVITKVGIRMRSAISEYDILFSKCDRVKEHQIEDWTLPYKKNLTLNRGNL